MDSQAGALPQSISTPWKESGSLCPYVACVLSIDKSHRSNKLEDRIDYLNEYHTYAVYRSGRLTAPRARRV